MDAQRLPFTITDMSAEEIKRRRARGLTKYVEAVRVNPGRALFPVKYRRVASILYNFEFRRDDIVLMSWPKTGSTWLREVLWAFTNLDRLHLADQQFLHTRTYSLNMDILSENTGAVYEEWVRRVKDECGDAGEDEMLVTRLAAAHQGSPRILITHLHFAYLNPTLLDTCKVVYLARNPKDLCISSYDFMRACGTYTGDLDTFADLLMDDEILPGSYWNHIQQAWQLRTHSNLHFMFYEDMRSDPVKELTKLNHFLGFNLTQHQLKCVEEHSSYKRMKAREDKVPVLHIKDGSSFYRGGRVGGWSNNALPQLSAKMDAWIAKHSNDIGITFRYE